MLAVHILNLEIGYPEKTFGVVVIFSAFVYLKLYAHIQVIISVENGVGLISIRMNGIALHLVIAGLAVRGVPAGEITGVIVIDKPSAAVAGGVLLITAGFTEGYITVSIIVFSPNSMFAALTNSSVLIVTVTAYILAVKG